MSLPRVAIQFGDGPNDGRGRGDAFGMFDNGVWENVLGIQFSPNAGPRNRDGLKTVEAHAAWLRDREVNAVIWTMWALASPWVTRLKAMLPDLKIIGLTDHPLNVDFLHWEPARAAMYVNSIERMDALMVLTPREAAFYGGLHKNVHCVGLPFPHGGYEHLRVARPAPMPKKEVLIGLSVGGPGWSWWDRNFLTTAYCFRLIMRAMERKGVKVSGVWLTATMGPDTAVGRMMETIPDCTVQYRSDMETYLKTLQSCDLVISHIVRDTPGRLVAESAFFGVPCIGSHSLSLQQELFGSLGHDPFDIVSTVNYATDLIENGCPPALIQNAQSSLKEYDFEHSRAKFRDVLESVGLGREWTSVEP